MPYVFKKDFSGNTYARSSRGFFFSNELELSEVVKKKSAEIQRLIFWIGIVSVVLEVVRSGLTEGTI